MHTAGALQEDTAVGWDRGGLAEQVLQHGLLGARRMRALRDLRELERIAQQDDVARRRSHRECVRQRDLARLVDHQRVHAAVQVLPREQPRGAGEEQDIPPGADEVGNLLRVPDRRAAVRRLLVGRRLLEPAEREPFFPRRLLHLGEQIVDHLVARRRHADAAAQAHEVCDEPRSRPRFPRARRTLDEEIGAVE